MRLVKYVLLFTAIQAVAAILAIAGIPICFLCSYALPGRVIKSPVTGLSMYTFPKWAWLWANDEDGIYPLWYHRLNYKWSQSRVEFVWTALRNPVNNLRFVPGVSKPGRPLFYRTFTYQRGRWKKGLEPLPSRTWYVKAGWEAKTGWPSLSAGAGKGF